MAEQKSVSAQLIRGVSLLGAVALLAGNVIGAGIFVTAGEMTGRVGPGAFLAFAIASIAVIFVCLYNTQLSMALPISGADYVCVGRVLHPLAGFFAGWNGLYALAIGAGLMGYATPLFLQAVIPDIPVIPVAWAVIILFAVINILGIRIATRAQIFMFFALTLLPLLVYISGGLPNIRLELYNPLLPAGIIPLLVVSAAAVYTYAGFTTITIFGAEIKNARRNIPLTLIISFVMIVAIYILVSFVLGGLMPWQDIAKLSAAVPETALAVLPPWMAYFVLAGGLFAILTSVNTTILVGGRVILALARDRVLPQFFSNINGKFHTPDRAIILMTILSMAVSCVGFTFIRYSILAVLGLIAVHMLVSTAVFYMPDKMTVIYAKSPLKFTRFWRWFSWIGMLALGVFFMIFGMLENWIIAPIYFGIMVIGAIYWYLRKEYLRRKGVLLQEGMRDLTSEAENELLT